jgi:uncharacterized protein (TIGR03437 family)
MPAPAQQSRITGKIDNAQRITLRGHLHPKALPQYDQGAVDPSLVMDRVTLMLQPTAAQQAALAQLLAEQQDPSSPNYHKWLTPEQFADRFGASQTDIGKITGWLRNQNLNVISVARGRDAISVSGTAAAVENAFRVEIHRYVVNGESHFANATEPSVPAAFDSVIGGIRGLNNFRLRPASRSRVILPGVNKPQYTSSGCGGHCLAPEDIATIYDLKPLYSSGLNGSGQKLAVVGQSNIVLSDIQEFRTTFNLPAINLQQVLVPGSANPGVVSGDEGESDLDLELSGAVAPDATIVFVYSTDVETSVEYAIDQNLAPVVSMSYGDCEAAYASSDASSMRALAQRANSQGMTWLAASGDNGATDCYGDGFPGANSMASVDMPASIPEVTGIGGTEFNEGSGNYWNAANDANGGSAISYIPEIAWNDTSIDGSPSASGGGPSTYFSKPSWQTGDNVPNDNARDVPDIAISASADHDGYIIYSSDGCGRGRAVTTCEQIVGGTSVGPPQTAGLLTLLNQRLANSGATPGLGNINPQLYSQAASSAFHDITTGNNIIDVTCNLFPRQVSNCTAGPVGYNAGPGYDLVTGIGSFDAQVMLAGLRATTAPVPLIGAVVNAASYTQAYAPGELVSVFGSSLASATQSASGVPLPSSMANVSATVNGMPAPLLYVSPTQVNLQIPYELTPTNNATLTINNSGQTASVSFTLAAAAPGIFTSNGALVPNSSAAPGETVTLFITGAGTVTPTPADGAAPSAGTPVPSQAVSITVGGVGVSTPFEFLGIPSGLVGTLQINYTVPANAPSGSQNVVVTVGGVASAPATLNVVP